MKSSEDAGLEKMEIEQPEHSFLDGPQPKGLIFSHKRHAFRLLNAPNDQESTRRLLEFMSILKASLPNMEINDIYKSLFSGDYEHLLMLESEKLIGGMTFTC